MALGRADAQRGLLGVVLPVDAQGDEAVQKVGSVRAARYPSRGYGWAEVPVEPVSDHLVVDDIAAAPVKTNEVVVEACPNNLNVHGLSRNLSDLKKVW